MKTMFRAVPIAAILAIGVSRLPADTPKAPNEPAPTAAQLRQSANNLKQIALAFHNYISSYNHFPLPAVTDKNGKALLSWRVTILPYIEEDKLYKEFNFEEAWDSDHNKKLLSRMPKLYKPVRNQSNTGDETYYRVFVNGGAFLDAKKKIGFADIADGTSNTILAIEAGESVPWTKPDELEYDPAKKVPALGGMFEGDFHFALADGSVRKFRKGKKDEVMHKLITRAGGEVMEAADWKP